MVRTGDCTRGIERRGAVYYMRLRVPARYRDVETRAEVNRSLKTRDLIEAEERFVVLRKQMTAEWDARLAQQYTVEPVKKYDSAVELMRAMSLPYRPMDELIAGRLEDLVDRVSAIAASPSKAPDVDAVLGLIDVPEVKISGLPALIEEVQAAALRSMCERQRRQWKTRYGATATHLVELFGDIPCTSLTEAQAIRYRNHWQARCDAREITSNYANKRVRYARQMLHAYFERFDVPQSRRLNPFKGYGISRPVDEETGSTLPLPNPWISRVVIHGDGLATLNPQAHGIAVVAADTGTGQTEVFDIPPADIRLDHPIPHLMMRIVAEGPDRRRLKNSASKRPIILLGASLDVMTRHRDGFPKYRGKATYPAAINAFMRDNELFPEVPAGEARRYTMSGTRHSFEDRLKGAGVQNEERAYMTGHSVGKIRGRPVYGSDPDLRMRALLQEMVSFRTPTWTPRPREVLWNEVAKLKDELGFTFS